MNSFYRKVLLSENENRQLTDALKRSSAVTSAHQMAFGREASENGMIELREMTESKEDVNHRVDRPVHLNVALNVDQIVV